MAKITLAVGLALVALGAFFYLTAETKAVTALIPAFVGIPVAILGALASFGTPSEKMRKHTAHIAVMLTLIGTLGGLGMGLPKIAKIGENKAVLAQILMGVICLVHVILSVRSFIAARKAREAAAGK